MTADDLQSRFEALDQRLNETLSADRREAVKHEIIALFHDVEAAQQQLSDLREAIRGLVDRYKQGASSGNGTPTVDPTQPGRPVHVDHIGASTYVEKGWTAISLGDFAGAIQSLERALELSPEATEAQALLGWAQMRSTQYDEALGTFSRVLMREPANALARVNVGYICLKKRIFGEAIEHLSRAIRLGNDRKATLYAHFYLGLVYLEREMLDDAETFFRKTLVLAPNFTEAAYELGRVQWLAGDREAARETWSDGWNGSRLTPHGKRCKEMLELADAGREIPRRSSA